MAKEKPDKCPDCKGPKRGRGYAHNPGCPTLEGKKPLGKRARKDGAVISANTPIAKLLEMRQQIDTILKDKDAKEVARTKEKISRLAEIQKEAEKLRAELAG